MVIKTKKYLDSLATVLNVQLDKKLLEDCRTTSTIFELLKKSKINLGPLNSIEKAEIQQYIEYALVYAAQADTSQNAAAVLKELNGILALKTYLVGNRLTVADIFLYYIIFNLLDTLTVVEKEQYLNLCRWFDNIQQDSSLRQSNKLISFNTNFLAAIVPAKH